MNNIIEWMIENKIAVNGFAAANISAGLDLPKYSLADQERMCKLYRAWRPKTDKKNMIPSYQCYDLVKAGIEPQNVPARQINLFEVAQ